MPDTTISGLTAAASCLDTDEFPINQGGETKKVTRAQIVSVVSNAASAADAHASVASLAATSVDTRVNTLSQAVSVISQQVSVLSQAHSALSQAHSALSQAVSVISDTLSNALSKIASVETHASTASAAATSADAHANTVSAAVETLSAKVVSISAQLTSLEVHASAASAAATSVNNRIASISVELGGGLVSQYLMKSSNAEYDFAWVSVAPGGGGGSVTSDELSLTHSVASHAKSIATNVSVLSQPAGSAVVGLQSALDVFSNMFSNAFSAGSVLSGEVTSIKSVISAKLPWLGAVTRIVSNTQSINTSTLADVSGLVLTVAAGELWRIDGMALLSTSAANAGLKAAMSVPPLSAPTGAVWGNAPVSVGALAAAGGAMNGFGNQVSGNSVFLNRVSTPAGSVFPLMWGGTFNIASAGTIRLMLAGVASTTASPLHILAGSHLIAYRLR